MQNFEEIYYKYSHLVMKVANNILKDYALVQDVAQEVFVSFYEQDPKIEEPYIQSWLLVNTKRKAIDYYRKLNHEHEKMERQVVVDRQKQNFAPNQEENIVQGIVAGELTDTILTNLKEHNEGWYWVMLKVVIRGEKPEKVAGELEISIDNMRIKLHRARKWIQKKYTETYQRL